MSSFQLFLNSFKRSSQNPYKNEKNIHKSQTISSSNSVVMTEIQIDRMQPQQVVKEQQFYNEEVPQPKKRQATRQELGEVVCFLRQKFPRCDISIIVSMMHEALLHKYPKQHYHSYDDLYLPIENNSPLQKPYDYTQDLEVTKQYRKQELQKTKFTNLQEENRYKEKRLAAKAFVAKGYGINHVQNQYAKAKFNSSTLTKDTYKTMIAGIANQAFKRLQIFLRQDVGKKIINIEKDEMKKIMTNLLSSNYYQLEHIATFKKYIRLIYGLSNVTLKQNQSVDFYVKVMEPLRGKHPFQDDIYVKIAEEEQNYQENNMQVNSTGENNPVLSETKDLEIASTYLQLNSMRQTSKILNIPMNQIRSKIFHLLEQSIKKLQFLSLKNSIKESEQCHKKLTTEQIGWINRSEKANQIRKQILTILLNGFDNPVMAYQIIYKIREKKQENDPDCQSVLSCLWKQGQTDLSAWENNNLKSMDETVIFEHQ